MVKIGLGYDIHRLISGRPLFLGGIEIPHSQGLLGHSDGDCLIHALADALLGAQGGGNIGELFPDTDPAYSDIRSTHLLAEVVESLHGRGMRVSNADTVVICQEPRLGPFLPSMKDALCPLLGVSRDSLSIKPRTNEGIGAVGRGEAIAALATVLIQSKD